MAEKTDRKRDVRVAGVDAEFANRSFASGCGRHTRERGKDETTVQSRSSGRYAAIRMTMTIRD